MSARLCYNHPPPVQPTCTNDFVASSRRYYFDFCRLGVLAEFSRDAARNRLGYVWWVLEPALMLAVFYLAFGVILQAGGKHFLYDLLVGVTLWSWFSGTIQRCTASIQQASQFMQLLYIPKHLLPLVCMISEAAKALILMAILLLVLGFTIGPSRAWLWLPVLFVTQFLFAGGCGLITAHLLPFMNDVKYMVTLLLRVGMFLSGVFYRIDEAVAEEYRDYLTLNPLAAMIAEMRRVLVSGEPPNFGWLLYVGAISLALLILGCLLISRYDKVYPRLLSR